MPKGMSEEVSGVIVQALAKGLSRSQICGVVGVSKRAITRISTNLKKHGSPKAPPSGVKLGRPAKMTNAQAQAMLAWIAERDYTFYVKDLVQYLRENHGYIGCDGTVRRCLVRTGFARKLPWHKSEITSWQPPEVLPTFSSDDEDVDEDASPARAAEESPTAQTSRPPPRKKQKTSAKGAASRNVASLAVAMAPQAQMTDPTIDPTLQDSLAPVFAPEPQQLPPTFHLDPSSSNQNPQRQSPVPPSTPSKPVRGKKQPGKRTAAAARLDAHPVGVPHAVPPSVGRVSAEQARATAALDGSFETTVTSLQSQLLRQEELIARLQRQLAEQQVQAPPQPRQAAAVWGLPARVVGGGLGTAEDDEDEDEAV